LSCAGSTVTTPLVKLETVPVELWLVWTICEPTEPRSAMPPTVPLILSIA